MAMTATIALSPTTVKTGQVCTASVTVSNSGASTVNVTNVQPNVLATGATNPTYNSGVQIGKVIFGPNVSYPVPASGTLVITFPVKFNGPHCGVVDASAATFTDGFTVGALCYSDDGSVFSPTATTVTVNYAVTYPTSQQ